MLTRLFVGVMALVCGGNAQDAASPLPAEVRQDAYELYSDLYRNSTSLEQGELLAIAMNINAWTSDATRCLKPRNREDQSLMDNFLEVNREQHQWEAQFNFGRPYKLLDAAGQLEVDHCFMARYQPSGVKCAAPYSKIRYIRHLSAPGFNRSRTRVLVFISRVCGGLCGDGAMGVYRRTNKGWQWEKDSFASTCAWVY